MNQNNKLTKREEREAMSALMKQREERTPKHANPGWIHHFWKERKS